LFICDKEEKERKPRDSKRESERKYLLFIYSGVRGSKGRGYFVCNVTLAIFMDARKPL